MLTASLLLSGLAVSFCSCGGGNDEPTVEPTKMTVSPTSLHFSSSGGSQTVKIQSNTSWSLIPSVGWITVSPMTGTGNSTVVISLSEQSSMDERSCEIIVQSDDDRKREIVYVTQQGAKCTLSVDVSELIFEENAKCERTIRITSNTKWTISEVPEWLDLSTTNGNGDASVQLITATDNNSSMERTGEIKISTSEGEYRKVTVQQKGKYVKDCKVEIADILTMANSVAFKYDFGSNVAYYYEVVTYPEVIERMTDVEIVEELLTGTRYIPSDGSISSFNLDPRTNYTICFVAFNKEDRQGELTFVDFSTPTDVNQAEAWISDISFDDQYWYWTETISAYCRYYYNYQETGSSPSDLTFGMTMMPLLHGICEVISRSTPICLLPLSRAVVGLCPERKMIPVCN